MYPELFRIGDFAVSSYGFMMAMAFIVAGAVVYKELDRRGLEPELAFDIIWRAALGGIIGAKVYYAILFQDPMALLSRGGLVWYGGLIGGTLFVGWFAWRRKLPGWEVVDSVAVALPLGYAVGRIGCFLVGDDYGRPTESWVGIAFPDGSPPTTVYSLRHYFEVQLPPDLPANQVLAVHPTQLYEVGMALIIFGLLFLWLRHRIDRPGQITAACIGLMSIERFVVEFWRVKDDRFFGPLTLAQLISVLLLAISIWFFMTRSSAESAPD